MPAYSVHDVSYDDTTTDEWSAPREHDFDTDDLSTIAEHFFLSASGFPPEEFGDLKLPVVEPDGTLNLNALETAYGGAHSVETIEGIDDDTVEDVRNRLQRLSDEAFDHHVE